MLRNLMKSAAAPVLALAIFAAGCDEAGDVMAPRQADANLLGTVGGVLSTTGNVVDGVLTFATESDPLLLRKLEDEKLRVAQELEASKGQYDAAKVEWSNWLARGNGYTNGRAVACDPIQYVATVKIVGPAGGDIDFGPHKLRIPAGALKGYTVITAEAPVGLSVKSRFRPHGLKFSAENRLTLSYKHCQGNVALLTKQVAYVDGFNNILEWRRSSDDRVNGLMYGWTDHFSDYLLAMP